MFTVNVSHGGNRVDQSSGERTKRLTSNVCSSIFVYCVLGQMNACETTDYLSQHRYAVYVRKGRSDSEMTSTHKKQGHTVVSTSILIARGSNLFGFYLAVSRASVQGLITRPQVKD